MGYGYKRVTPSKLNLIVDRLTTPTRASTSWRYDYNAQEENLKYLKLHDPRIHPRHTVSPDKLDNIVGRLSRPTTASIAAIWNFDHQDANLAYLKQHDDFIQLPYKTYSPTNSEGSTRGKQINVEDFLPLGGSVCSPKNSPGSSRSPSPQRKIRSNSMRRGHHGRQTVATSTVVLPMDQGRHVNGASNARAYKYMVK